MAVTLLGVVLVVLVGYYTRPKNLGPLLERILSHEAGGDVTLGQATLSWDGRLVLDRVKLAVPGLSDADAAFARVFQASRISLDVDLGALRGGVLRVEDVSLEQPRVYLTEDPDRGLFNVALLQPPPDQDEDEERGFELRLPPAIRLEAARVHMARFRDGHITPLDVLRLDGELNEDPAHKRRYDFELRQYDRDGRVQATLTGSVDTRQPALDLKLNGLRVDTAHRQLVPSAFRDFWDQLRPTGSLPNLTLSVSSDDAGRWRIQRAVLELHDVALSPPYAALELPAPAAGGPGPRDLPRMTEVHGRLVLEDQTLTVEDLTGMIEGVRYHAQGRWALGDGGGGGVFEVSTDPFTLEQSPPYLASLPPVVTKIFDRLSPGGTFRATTRIERAADDAELDVRGSLEVIDGRAMYHKFAYPLHGVTGRISFDREVVRIERIVGHGPGGGVVRIDGEIAPPGDGAAVRVVIQASDVPFDDHLLAALSDERRKAIDLFFDAGHYDRLVREGLVRSPAGAAADLAAGRPSDVPVFEPGGRVNVDVLVDRPLGPHESYRTTVTVDARGVSALFKHWPYPVTGRGGRVIVRDKGGGVTLDDVVLESPTGGRATLDGRIETPQGDGEYPDLTVRDAAMPLDALLLSTIPGDARKTVSDLHLQGRGVGSARITKRPGDRDTRWRVDARIVDGSARPNDGRYALSDLRGGIELSNHALTLRGFTAQRGDTRFAVDGRFAWEGKRNEEGDDEGRDGATPGGAAGEPAVEEHAELHIRAQGLRVDSALLDLLPPAEPMLGKLMLLDALVRPLGLADAELRWVKTPPPPGGEPRATYQLDLRPQALAMDYKGQRISVEDMSGSLRLRPGRLDLDRLAGRSGEATGEVDGLVGLDGVEATAIALSATDRADSPLTRKLLPGPVARVLEAMSVGGRYRLRDARLLRHPAAAAGQTGLEFEGVVELSDARLEVGLPVTGLWGTLGLSIRQTVGDKHPAMRFEVDARELRAADRRVAPLAVTLSNHDDPAVLSFDPLLGSVYGGVLVASGRVPLDAGGRFTMRLTLSDVAVDPFVKPADADPTYGRRATVDPATGPDPLGYRDAFAGGDRFDPSGLLSASLSIEAPLADPRRRRGRGTLSVADATLYDRPLSNAILRASNLSLPSGAPLDAANARFLIDGQTVHLDQLALTGPGLTIAGTGTMTWPDTRLNLLMVSRSGGVLPRLGPVSDLIDLFKNELIAIRVQGTLAEPQTSLTTLRDLRVTLDETFESFENTLHPPGN